MNDFQRFLESQRQTRAGAPMGPGAILARAVGMVAAVGLIALSLLFGAFVLTALLAIGLVGGVALRVWLWWQQRKLAAAGGATRPRPRRPLSPDRTSAGDIVEGEFEVLHEERQRRPEDH